MWGRWDILSQSVDCQFVVLTVSFALQKLLRSRGSHLSIVALSVCATGVTFRKQSPLPINSRLFPTLSSSRFSVAGFMLRSLIHFDLSLCKAIGLGLAAVFYMSATNYASTIC